MKQGSLLVKAEYTDFHKDITKGKPGVRIFKDDFLEFLQINYEDVTDCHAFQVIDCDLKTTIGTYEIKLNYKDDKQLVIEEYTNINKKLGPISLGWFYKSEADLLVFISKQTRTMVFLPFTKQFKEHYESIKEKYKLIWNKISENKKTGSQWQSAYRRIPLSIINGYFSYYKRINNH